MDRAQVMRWMSGYETTWRAEDAEALTPLFTLDAHDRAFPYGAPADGASSDSASTDTDHPEGGAG